MVSTFLSIISLRLLRRSFPYPGGSFLTSREPAPRQADPFLKNVIYVSIQTLTNTIIFADDLDRQLLLAIVSQVPGYDVLRLVDMEKIAETASRTFRLATTNTDLN